jgi:hypothetical protein
MSQARNRDAPDVQPDVEFATGTVLAHDSVLTILTSLSHSHR